MTTARDLVTQSLRDAGIVGLGNAPSAEEINQGFARLNQMIYQWRRSRWLIFVDRVISLQMTGAVEYSVGPGGDFDTGSDPRPDRLEDGCRVVQVSPPQPNQVGWPLQIISSYEDYQKITQNQLNSMPQWIFYRSDYPLGYVRPYPVPSSNYNVEILIKKNLQSFANLSEAVSLPLEYETAINYNMVVRNRLAYRRPPDPQAIRMATASLQAIKNANTQVPTLRMPPALIRPGIYNIYSDQTN